MRRRKREAGSRGEREGKSRSKGDKEGHAYPPSSSLPSFALMAISLRGMGCFCSSNAGTIGRDAEMARLPSSLSLSSSPARTTPGKLAVTIPESANFSAPVPAASRGVPTAMKWWEKNGAPNMTEIGSAQELADALLAAGDRLVVIDFYSPGCGGCRTLHPKICQIAEQKSDVVFLQVNYEEHKSLCTSLHVHVLPFFRFYRGSAGRVCSFSCTVATIKKFRDALAKHGGERTEGVAGLAKGLEEAELRRLASNGDLVFAPPTPSALGTASLTC